MSFILFLVDVVQYKIDFYLGKIWRQFDDGRNLQILNPKLLWFIFKNCLKFVHLNLRIIYHFSISKHGTIASKFQITSAIIFLKR